MSTITLERYTPLEEIEGFENDEKNMSVRFEVDGEATMYSLLDEFERFCLAIGYQRGSIDEAILEKADSLNKNDKTNTQENVEKAFLISDNATYNARILLEELKETINSIQAKNTYSGY